MQMKNVEDPKNKYKYSLNCLKKQEKEKLLTKSSKQSFKRISGNIVQNSHICLETWQEKFTPVPREQNKNSATLCAKSVFKIYQLDLLATQNIPTQLFRNLHSKMGVNLLYTTTQHLKFKEKKRNVIKDLFNHLKYI